MALSLFAQTNLWSKHVCTIFFPSAGLILSIQFLILFIIFILSIKSREATILTSFIISSTPMYNNLCLPISWSFFHPALSPGDKLYLSSSYAITSTISSSYRKRTYILSSLYNTQHVCKNMRINFVIIFSTHHEGISGAKPIRLVITILNKFG